MAGLLMRLYPCNALKFVMLLPKWPLHKWC
uniref:Uncharacterized protein n=1 Tax=Rhizophora mucronata TaxID=61149 RepID=A0A2P2QY35_RHIMU